jgi:7-cyano-7-deazaguanine synthase in queuosine biosynthesis
VRGETDGPHDKRGCGRCDACIMKQHQVPS